MVAFEDPAVTARVRAKRYLKLLRAHIDMMDELIHLLAEEEDHIPQEAQLEIADAVRHFRAMSDSLTAADRRIRSV